MADINGDYQKELIYNNIDGEIKVGVISEDGTNMTIKSFNDNFVLGSSINSDCMDPDSSEYLSIPHSAAYLDLDGDCLADIFFTKYNPSENKYYIEIY